MRNAATAPARPERCCVLPQPPARVRVSGVLDDQPRLRSFAASEHVRAPLLGYHRRMLERGGGIRESGHDRRAVAALVPGTQRDHRVATR